MQVVKCVPSPRVIDRFVYICSVFRIHTLHHRQVRVHIIIRFWLQRMWNIYRQLCKIYRKNCWVSNKCNFDVGSWLWWAADQETIAVLQVIAKFEAILRKYRRITSRDQTLHVLETYRNPSTKFCPKTRCGALVFHIYRSAFIVPRGSSKNVPTTLRDSLTLVLRAMKRGASHSENERIIELMVPYHFP